MNAIVNLSLTDDAILQPGKKIKKPVPLQELKDSLIESVLLEEVIYRGIACINDSKSNCSSGQNVFADHITIGITVPNCIRYYYFWRNNRRLFI